MKIQRLQSAAAALASHAFWRSAELFDLGRLKDMERLRALAVEFDPRIRRRLEWIVMSVKARLGPRLWQFMRPAAQLFRRRADAARSGRSEGGGLWG